MLLTAAEITRTVNNETKQVAWKITKNNFHLEFIQRSPQQTRSFFQARGFSAKIANDIATQCVLQTIIKNTEDENTKDSISVSLKKWRINSSMQIKESPVKLKETWDKEWQEEHISNAARVAFRWATFPTEQTFEPGGDFNWGMISFGPKPATLFDLKVFWKQDDQSHYALIKNMQCPPDTTE